MEPQRLFSDKSDLYASARPKYPAELYDYLASVAPNQDRAWDCACGNGQVAIDLVQRFERVDATDISNEQIAEVTPLPGVSFGVGSAEATGYEDHSFDLICVGQALHWFNYDRFWPEVDRLLKPGGVFAAWGYIFFNSDNGFDQVLEETLYPIIKPYWSERNRLLWNHYREVAIPYRRLEAPKFRMTVSWDVEELLAYIHTWSAVRRCMDEQGDGFYLETCRGINELWGEGPHRRTIEMDFCFVATQKDR